MNTTMMRKQSMKKSVASVLATATMALGLALMSPAAPAAAATVAIDLYAVTGSTTLPGGEVVNVLGFSETNAPVTEPGGPTLEVNQGDEVTITLHNTLSVRTGLLLRGMEMVPDLNGIPASDPPKTYTFTAGRPGTYLYEAALLPGAQYQTAMGLYGALIVRPATAGQAYGANTAFDDEATLVLSEIDPALNNAADPAAFDMRKFAPEYSLVNGKAHPNTTPIATGANRKVLLRYVNAGTLYRSMAVLGADQSVVALDGSPLSFPGQYVAETFGPGQTADAIVTTADATSADTQIPVYDGSLLLHNSSLAGAGGMLTFLTVPGTGPGADTVGPVTSLAAFGSGTLTANVDDTGTGATDIQAAEYYLDSVAGSSPTGTLDTVDAAFDSPAEDVTGTVSMPPGEHILYVRGQDALGNWGEFSSVLVDGGDVVGPATSGPRLHRNPANGTANVAVHATGDDTASGASNISAAEYFIGTDPGEGTGSPLAVNKDAVVASLDGTITSATVGALPEGEHVVSIRSQDAAGNWGTPVTITLVVDKTGPDATGLTVAPNPNNGTIPFSASIPAVRVEGLFTDPLSGGVNSTLRKAEGFIDTVGSNNQGIKFGATDGVFDSTSELGYTDIPLATIQQLSNGTHTIYVHVQDKARNWGPMAEVELMIDKTGPTVTNVTADPNPTVGSGTVALTATATDALSPIGAAEWWTGTNPGTGNGTPMTVSGSDLSATIDVSGWPAGEYRIRVRARDSLGNWGRRSSTLLVVS